MSLATLVEPESIGVIGASADPSKAGYLLLENIVVNGYEGTVYPINPRAESILGLKCYPDVTALPEAPDVVFFLVPAERLKASIEQCVARGVKAGVIVTAGFSETGEQGARAEREIAAIIKQAGMRCTGPNTVGVVNKQKNLVASFVPFKHWADGPVALGAQTGNFTGCIADEIMTRDTQRFGICKSVPLGNKIDLDEVDFLDYCWKDAAAQVIGLHLEDLRRPREFLELARQVTRDKPVIVLKTGRTAGGMKAAASHTGSLAIEDRLVNAFFRQVGIIRVTTLDDYLCALKCFAFQPLPRGKRVAILTHSGANGVMGADELDDVGLELAPLSDETRRRINKLMPPWQEVSNPADIWLALGQDNRGGTAECLNAMMDDPNTDMVLFLSLPLVNSDFDGVRQVFEEAIRRHPEKPIFMGCYGGDVKRRWRRDLEGLNIPIEDWSVLLINAMGAMYRYTQVRGR